MAIAPQQAISGPFRDGLAPSLSNDAQGRSRWGYADAQNRAVIAPAFDSNEPFADGLAVVGVADAWGKLGFGAVDVSGRLVLPAVHEKLLKPSGGTVRAEYRDRPHRVFDRNRQDITPPGIDFVGIAAEGMVRIWTGRKQGFMTVAGEVVIAPRFDRAAEFTEGLAVARVGPKYGFMDKQGCLAIAARYDFARPFHQGLGYVLMGREASYITAQDEVVWHGPSN